MTGPPLPFPSMTTQPPRKAPSLGGASRTWGTGAAGERERHIDNITTKLYGKGFRPSEIATYLKTVENIDLSPHLAIIQDPQNPKSGPGITKSQLEGKALALRTGLAGGRDPAFGGLILEMLQGLSLGVGSEAVGSLMGAVSGEGAQAGRDIYRAALAQQEKDTPILAPVAKGIGGLITFAGTPSLLGTFAGMAANTRWAQASAKLVARMVDGGLIGGTVAAAETEGDLTTRLEAGKKGAAAGSLLGGAFSVSPKAAGTIAGAGLGAAFGPGHGPGMGVINAFAGGILGNQAATITSRLFGNKLPGAANAYAVGDAIVVAREMEAAPFRNAANKEYIKVTDRISQIFSEPEMRMAYDLGRRKAIREDLRDGITNIPSVPVLELDGSTITNTILPLRAIDLTKRGLRDLARSSERAQADLKSSSAGDFFGLANDLRDEGAKQSANYKKYLEIYAGDSEVLEALQRGKGGDPLNKSVKRIREKAFHERPVEVIDRQLKGMKSQVEREMFIVGALQDLHESMIKSPTSWQIWRGSPGWAPSGSVTERQISILFPDRAIAREVLDGLRAEAKLKGFASLVGKSLPPIQGPPLKLSPGQTLTGPPTMPQLTGGVAEHLAQLKAAANQQNTRPILTRVGSAGVGVSIAKEQNKKKAPLPSSP